MDKKYIYTFFSSKGDKTLTSRFLNYAEFQEFPEAIHIAKREGNLMEVPSEGKVMIVNLDFIDFIVGEEAMEQPVVAEIPSIDSELIEE